MAHVKRIVFGLAMVGLLLVAAPAWSAECDDLLAEVDALLASETLEVAEELIAEARLRRDDGAASCAAGDHEQAVAELSQAKFMLGGFALE